MLQIQVEEGVEVVVEEAEVIMMVTEEVNSFFYMQFRP